MNNKQSSVKNNVSFSLFATWSIVIMFFFSGYAGYLLYYSKNSYSVYENLKIQRNNLNSSIYQLQYDNSKLQKRYLELQNLEPE
jgi:lipopolysaccharide assembly outer membrane protein LptD (OstA)